MIDEEITYREKGYRSTDLKPQSHKEVWAVCEGVNCQREGGRGRWLMFRDYRDLCFGCARKVGSFKNGRSKPYRIQKCETPTEKLPWIDDDITYAEKGYRSTWLKPQSNKLVWCVCANPNCQREGGRGRWLKFQDCREFCRLCVHNGRKNSEETIILMSKLKKGKSNPMYGRTGESCPAWMGGISSERDNFYNSPERKQWRISVFERDDYTCQECGERGVVLNAHHILPYRDWKEPRFSLNIKNGITLCEKCHNKTKTKEYEFFNKYFDIVNGVGKK